MTTTRTRRPRGQAMVEFAVALPVFLVLLLGVFDLGRGVYMWNGLSEAAREIARATAVHPGATLGSSTETRAKVQIQLGLVPGMVDPPTYVCVDITGTPNGHSTCSTDDYVQVTVNATYRPLSFLGIGGPISMSSTSSIQIP